MANRRVPYLYTKRGVFYLQKRVPADLQHRYGRPFIRKSLRTKDPKQANRLASSLVDGLEREWIDLRFGISEETPASDFLLLQREQEILLLDACVYYCRMKGRTDDTKFRQLAERVTKHVISLSGDREDASAQQNADQELNWHGSCPSESVRHFMTSSILPRESQAHTVGLFSSVGRCHLEKRASGTSDWPRV